MWNLKPLKRLFDDPPPSSEPPVRIICPSESELELTHLASERLELCCEISEANAPVRWYRDSLEVEEGPNLILEANGAQRRLVIPMTTVDDTGEYVCDTEDESVAFLVTVTGINDNGGYLILIPILLACLSFISLFSFFF